MRHRMIIKTHCWERATKGECEFAEVALGFMTALRAAMILSCDGNAVVLSGAKDLALAREYFG